MSDKAQSQHKEIKVINVNGNNFVVGLDWKSLNNARKHMKEAKDYGKKNGLDVVAIKKGDYIQAGFAPKQAKSIKGMYSLAVSLVSLIEGTWIGVFPVEEPDAEKPRYILIASGENGAVIPWTDLIVSESEVKSLVDGLKNDLYDPDSNSVVDVIGDISFSWVTREVSLSEVLLPDNLNKRFKLKPLTFGLTKQQFITLGVIIVAVTIGLFGLNYYLDKKALEEERVRLENIAKQDEINKQARYLARLESLRHPWIDKPSIQDFILTCDDKIKIIQLSIVGWLPVVADCTYTDSIKNNGSAKMKMEILYNKNGESPANVTDFMASVYALYGVIPYFNAKDNTLSAFHLLMDVKSNGDDPILPLSIRTTQLVTVLQKNTIQFTVAPPQPVNKDVNVNVEDKDIPKPDWGEVNFSYESLIPPRLIFKDINLDGVRLNTISYKINNEAGQITYSVEGTVYGSDEQKK